MSPSPSTVLKEEADDLSHLAPTPGDACIPLDETTSFLASYEELNDLIDNYIYGDGVTGFEAVTAADIPTESSGSSETQLHSPPPTDSYFAESKSASEEMTFSNGSLLHKPLLKDAIISENVFAPVGLTINVNSQILGDEVLNCSGLDLMIESSVVAATSEEKMDPFITYRDESSDTSCATSHMLSPDDCSMQVSEMDDGFGWRPMIQNEIFGLFMDGW